MNGKKESVKNTVKKMSFWTCEHIKQITAGRWLHRSDDLITPPTLAGVSIDTRTLKPGHVFFAITGPNFDGHKFLQSAIIAGSPLLIVSREDVVDGLNPGQTSVLLVNDTLGALGRLAAAWRRSFNAKVIAITGSVGKTTTKEMTEAVLSITHRGKASPKSFNNHIGVPLTLLSVEPTDRYVIVEVGSNAPGEIAQLSRWIEPDVAVITHIGQSHLEKLGDLQSVAREKSSLLSHLREGGLAVVNGDADSLKPHLKVVHNLITFGTSDHCDLRLTQCQTCDFELHFEVNRRTWYDLPTLGQHNAINALAAIAVGRSMKLTDQQIAQGLKNFKPPDMRLNIMKTGHGSGAITILNDAYNANPDSVTAALKVLSDFPTSGRRVAILGDMLELGDQSPQLHRQIGQQVVQTNIDQLILIGKESMFTAEAVTRNWPENRVQLFSNWTDDLPRQVADELKPGDTILIKASRGLKLERLIPIIEQKFSGQ